LLLRILSSPEKKTIVDLCRCAEKQHITENI
jgi:hypothetical protein